MKPHCHGLIWGNVGELLSNSDSSEDSDSDVNGVHDNRTNLFSLTYPPYSRASIIADDASWSSGAEYGEHVHDSLRDAFESHHTTVLLEAAGQVIGRAGGLQAMQGAYYSYNAVLLHMAASAQMPESVARPAISALLNDVRSEWQGVHGWNN